MKPASLVELQPGDPAEPVEHKEPLHYEEVQFQTRSYK